MSFLFRARPLTYRLQNRLRKASVSLANAASEQIEIAPGARVQSFDALCLPDEEFRATGTLSNSRASLEGEQKSARRCIGVNGPTLAYRLDDALLADSTCYAGGWFENLRSQKRRPLVLDRVEEIEEAQLCTDTGAELFFGHWLCDAMCTELLAIDRQLPALSLAGAKRTHEPGYRQLLSLPAHPVSVARVRRLWIIDDKGYNPHRIQRLKRLRQAVRSQVVPGPGHKVFVDRGTSGMARNLVNRDAVLERLSRRGFIVIAPERMTAREIAESLAGASLVVGVEGSHLNHALLALPEGAGILAIQPPDRFNMFNKYIAELVSLRFGFVVADAHPGGFSVDPERLERTIDLF